MSSRLSEVTMPVSNGVRAHLDEGGDSVVFTDECDVGDARESGRYIKAAQMEVPPR